MPIAKCDKRFAISHTGGYRIKAIPQLSKLKLGVRFPLPAPILRQGYGMARFVGTTKSIMVFRSFSEGYLTRSRVIESDSMRRAKSDLAFSYINIKNEV